MSADVLHVQNFAQWKAQILAVIPALTGNNIMYPPWLWIYIKVPPHEKESNIASVT